MKSMKKMTIAMINITSTPIKIKFKCEECKDKSQCTDCFVRQDWAIAHDRVQKVAF